MQQSQPIQSQPMQMQPMQAIPYEQAIQQQPIQQQQQTFNPNGDILLNEISRHQMVNAFAVNLVASQDCCCYWAVAYCNCKDAIDALDRGDGVNYMLKTQSFNDNAETSKKLCAWCNIGYHVLSLVCCFIG